LASHGQWILLPSHPKHSQNHPGLVKANLKDYWSKEIWPSSSKLIQKGHLVSQGQWILWPGHPKHSQKHPGLAEGHPEGSLVQGNLASQFKRL
jgi:hypothetical protein